MKLMVATDAHIFKTPDGKYWSKNIYEYQFWTRYLNVFDSVRIVARVKSVENHEKLAAVDGPGVEVFGIPFYQGPKQLLKKYLSIQKALKGVSEGCDAALFRLPSQTAQMALNHTNKEIPIAGEIVYDPFDDLTRPEDGFVLRVLRKQIHRNMKKFCLVANGVSYVTNESIQKHYPSYARLHGEDSKHFETSYSTITLTSNAFTAPRDYTGKKSLCAALSAVSMNDDRKGVKVLIDAVKEGRDKGYDLKAVIIGDGSMRPSFEQYALERGVENYITFTGLLPSSDAVREVMLDADIFVFPTQAEGLPRGILEAMAIGMPVLSTPVGGIPEVLDEDCMFDPKDSHGFCMAMCGFLDDTEKMTQLSKKNFEISKQYENDKLQKKRDEFYRKIANTKKMAKTFKCHFSLI